MLASNTFVATFVLCLLISFTEISQGSENQPKSVNEGKFGLKMMIIIHLITIIMKD